jgi:protein archease
VRILQSEDRRDLDIKDFRPRPAEPGSNEGNVPVLYETFEHEADVGIRGFGGSAEEAFENAALALYSVMVNVDAVVQRVSRTVAVSAPDREQLLVEWLNALLAVSDIERLVFSRFTVRIEGTELRGTAWGEALDRRRHEAHVEVKGATYHMLVVVEREGRHTAQCVVDV